MWSRHSAGSRDISLWLRYAPNKVQARSDPSWWRRDPIRSPEGGLQSASPSIDAGTAEFGRNTFAIGAPSRLVQGRDHLSDPCPHFSDSNGDGIGDFQGLAQRLDYVQELGVTAIWLMPFFPSPLRDDGYDISDYRSVHPSYGTLEDFKMFLSSCS